MWTCPPSSPFPSRVSVRCPNGVWLPAPPQTSPSPNISALCLGQITALCPAAPSSIAPWDAELHPHPSASSSICILILCRSGARAPLPQLRTLGIPQGCSLPRLPNFSLFKSGGFTEVETHLTLPPDSTPPGIRSLGSIFLVSEVDSRCEQGLQAPLII